MAAKILQLNFKFNVPRADYEQLTDTMAGEFAKVKGLQWKIWIMNESESEAGGIYLFEDESSLEALLSGPLAAQVSNHPAISEMSVKKFDVMANVTAITRGPI